jgi:hypothetical protein
MAIAILLVILLPISNGVFKSLMVLISGSQQIKQRRLKSARLVGVYVSIQLLLHIRSWTDLKRYEKPWVEASPYKNRERWDKIILWGCITFGFGVGFALCALKYSKIARHEVSLTVPCKFSNILC